MRLNTQVFLSVVLLGASTVRAQAPPPQAGTSGDRLILELRQALLDQQRQIENLREDMRRGDAQLELLKRMLMEIQAASQSRAASQPAVVPEARPEQVLQLQAGMDRQQEVTEALRNMLESHRDRLAQLELRESAAAPTQASPVQHATGPKVEAVQSQAAPAPAAKQAETRAAKWYDRIGLRGYSQVRYNRLLETNPDLVCEQCDRSIGNNNSFFIRRARLVFSGDINDRVSMYFQQDFATASGALNFGQIRDLYFDVNLDKKKEFRVRIGQSKVPFGFENLQSSQNRPALDRSDSLNSAVANERDLGVYVMWAPAHIRQRFKYLVDSGLKGTGDYGVVATGVFNGQTANRPEANDNLHSVARITYPFQLGNGQIIEPGVQAYTGRFVVADRGASTRGPSEFRDYRTAFSLVVYPQPIGFQAEYNTGRGPTFNPGANSIEERNVQGGYGQVMYRIKLGNQFLTPFVKAQYYGGGKKHELDARRYLVRDQEFGLEWQPMSAFEFTAIYAHSDRTFEDSSKPQNRQKGNLLRLQAQFNY